VGKKEDITQQKKNKNAAKKNSRVFPIGEFHIYSISVQGQQNDD